MQTRLRTNLPVNYAALVESVQGGYKLSAERSRVALSKSRVGLTLDVGKEVTTGNILEDQTIKRLSLKKTSEIRKRGGQTEIAENSLYKYVAIERKWSSTSTIKKADILYGKNCEKANN